MKGTCERSWRGGRKAAGWVVAVGLVAAVGCAGGGRGEGKELVIDGQEYARMYRAAKLVLREQGFVLDQRDYRYGLVSSRPRFSPTLLEPWYADNLGLSGAAESTLNQERRVVEVWLKPLSTAQAAGQGVEGAQSGEFLLDVQVWVERRQRPGRYLTGSMDEAGMVGYWRTEPAGRSEKAKAAWRRVGRDAALEEQLRKEIVRRSVRLEETVSEAVGEKEAP